MAINKDDFKNAEGNYEAKNTLMDAVIDGVNGNEANLSVLLPCQAGAANFGAITASTTVELSVTFPRPFAAGKSVSVVATLNSLTVDLAVLSVANTTTTGFTVRAIPKTTQTSLWFHWIAMERN